MVVGSWFMAGLILLALALPLVGASAEQRRVEPFPAKMPDPSQLPLEKGHKMTKQERAEYIKTRAESVKTQWQKFQSLVNKPDITPAEDVDLWLTANHLNSATIQTIDTAAIFKLADLNRKDVAKSVAKIAARRPPGQLAPQSYYRPNPKDELPPPQPLRTLEDADGHNRTPGQASAERSLVGGSWQGAGTSGHAQHLGNVDFARAPVADPVCTMYVTMQNVGMSIDINEDGTVAGATAVAEFVETGRCQNRVSDRQAYIGTGVVTGEKLRLELAAVEANQPQCKGAFTGEFKNGRLTGWLEFDFHDRLDQWVTKHKVALVPQPEVLSWVYAEYTTEARAARLEGSVTLRVQIDSTGGVIDSKVLRGLGLGLDEKAVEAVKKWKFIPLYKAGRPTAGETNIEVIFRL
jgi:TonB family protein